MDWSGRVFEVALLSPQLDDFVVQKRCTVDRELGRGFSQEADEHPVWRLDGPFDAWRCFVHLDHPHLIQFQANDVRIEWHTPNGCHFNIGSLVCCLVLLRVRVSSDLGKRQRNPPWPEPRASVLRTY